LVVLERCHWHDIKARVLDGRLALPASFSRESASCRIATDSSHVGDENMTEAVMLWRQVGSCEPPFVCDIIIPISFTALTDRRVPFLTYTNCPRSSERLACGIVVQADHSQTRVRSRYPRTTDRTISCHYHMPSPPFGRSGERCHGIMGPRFGRASSSSSTVLLQICKLPYHNGLGSCG
jgi:hypothetical protein